MAEIPGPGRFEELVYEVDDGVAWIRMNRPARRNAFSTRMYGEARWAVRWADHQPDVDVVVLTGTDGAFATGGDLDEVLERVSQPDGMLLVQQMTDAQPFDALRLCTKPVIAAINGVCYAGGLIAAAWCDIQIAVRSARFCLPEGKVGVVEAYAPAVLFGRIPLPKLKYHYMTAKPFSADDAERWGLITEVVDDGQLAERVHEVVAELRQTSPIARRAMKRYLHEFVPRPYDQGVNTGVASDELREGLEAFVDKRAPGYGPRAASG